MQYKNYSIENVVNEALRHNPSLSGKKFFEALELAQKHSSKDQLIHSLNSAMILAEQEVDEATILGALLYNAFPKIENSSNVEKAFGKEVVQLLSQCNKINQIIDSNKKKIPPEKLGKIVLAVAQDIRCVFLKLADELMQLRHNQELSKEEQLIQAELSMKLFVPIAHKLGLEGIKWELEDLSFKILNPKEYEKIKHKVSGKRQEREKNIESMVQQTNSLLEKHNIKAKAFGRAKNFYSIFQKMNKKNLSVEQIHDLNAIRVVCNSEKDCYLVLGLIHSQFEPIIEEFDDYIANPKPSGYKSIHTYFKTKQGEIFEAQIMTWEMHIEAEEGLAAHWAYKKFLADPYFDPKLKWAKNVLQWFKKEEPSRIFSSINLQLDYDKIFVLTPKSEVIELPKGSTPIDFAYAIHSSIGEKAVKAIINGKTERLDHKLQNGDLVEILTSPQGRVQSSWLNFVHSAKAKIKIRQKLGIHKHPVKEPKKALIALNKKIITAKCCHPLPGDEVIGIKTTKRKIIVHKKSCENLKKINKNKFVELDWNTVKQKDFDAKIFVEAIDRLNLLNDLMKAVSKTNTKILSTQANISGEIAKSSFNLSIKSQKEMDKLIENLSRVKGVIRVERN